MQISGRAPELSLEQREKRKLAKRIIKSTQPSLEDALRKESELSGKPFEKELKDLDRILENSVLSRRASLPLLEEPQRDQTGGKEELPNGKETTADEEVAIGDKVQGPADEDRHDDFTHMDASIIDSTKEVEVNAVSNNQNGEHLEPVDKEALNGDSKAIHEDASSTNVYPHTDSVGANENQRPILPPHNPRVDGEQELPPLAQGGIQWYMQPFDPIGTTIHEERWTGREVLRGMSEELSEIDEDELRDLVDDEVVVSAQDEPQQNAEIIPSTNSTAQNVQKPKVHKTRRRRRGFR